MHPTERKVRPARRDELAALLRVDDAATELYATAGVPITLPNTHPFVLAEVARWSACLAAGTVWVAEGEAGEAVGFAAVGRVDGAAYLDQLSVHPRWARRGLGRALLARVMAEAGGEDLWLTTYDHVPWNRPFYESEGFRTVPDEQCGSDVQRILAEQRAVLPQPDRRVAMVRRA